MNIGGCPQEGEEDTATDMGIPDGDPFANFIEGDTDGQHEGHDVGEASLEDAQGGAQIDDGHAGQGDVPRGSEESQGFFVFHNFLQE